MTHFLSADVHDETLTDIAADMWNHGLDMSLRNTTFAPGEMRQIADYIWFSRAIEGDNYVFDRDLYDQHEKFAGLWDKNLSRQGFIEALARRGTQS